MYRSVRRPLVDLEGKYPTPQESVQLRLAMSILETHALGAGVVSKKYERQGPTCSLNIGLVCAEYLSSAAPLKIVEPLQHGKVLLKLVQIAP